MIGNRTLPRVGATAIASVAYVRARARLSRGLGTEPIDSLLDRLGRPTRTLEGADPVGIARALEQAERVLARTFPRADSCLFRALARYAALSSVGVRAVFVLGAPHGDASGHAWVEVGGRPFMEPGTPRFVRTLEHANGRG